MTGRGRRDDDGGPARALRVAWAAPCTAVGLVAAALLCLAGGHARPHDGVLEAVFPEHRPTFRRWQHRLPFRAITLGHVVLAATRAERDAHRAHERVHVRQYERWGLLFFVAYPLASAWAVLRGGRAYRDNVFEVEARREAGG